MNISLRLTRTMRKLSKNLNKFIVVDQVRREWCVNRSVQVGSPFLSVDTCLAEMIVSAVWC